MGKEAIVFYRRLADHLSRRSSTSYSQTLDALCRFLCYGRLQCASVEVARSILHRSLDASLEMGCVHRDY